MTDEISIDDTKQGVAKRGDDGELIPEEHSVDLPHGEEVTIKTKPITTGLLNELSDLDDAIENLEPEAVHEAFQTIYLSDAILGLSVEEIRDTRAEYLNSYLEPVDNAVESSIGDEIEGQSGNPIEMDRSERARKMR